MFVEIPGKDGKLTTPLKRALYNLDTWTWKPFYEWINANKAMEKGSERFHKLEAAFIKQNAEQTEHVDLESLKPLIKEYEAYDIQVQKWYRYEISDAEIDSAWKKLFEKQFERLPFHMIREMCREGNGIWKPESSFDAKTAPKGGCVYDYSAGWYIKLDSDEFLSRFGSSLGVVRAALFRDGFAGAAAGAWPRVAGRCAWSVHGVRVPSHDADSIRQLCKVRTSDLASIPTLAETEEKISALRK
jgi:hypothetical protein